MNMSFQKIEFSLLFSILLSVGVIQAQEATPATGGKASGAGGTVSYTVGQVGYVTNNGLTGSVAAGVQQPYEISVIASAVIKGLIDLSYSVYPNPATDLVNLKIDNYEIMDLNYQLFDLTGKLLQTKKIESSETAISLKTLSQATYFLKITKNNNPVKSFKIIKN
jgi:hypothetical protein